MIEGKVFSVFLLLVGTARRRSLFVSFQSSLSSFVLEEDERAEKKANSLFIEHIMTLL